MASAETLFDQATSQRGGRLDVSLLADRDLATRLEQARERFGAAIRTAVPPNEIHFDFIDNPKPGAVAGRGSHGFRYVGLTLGLIPWIDELTDRLARSGLVKQELQTLGTSLMRFGLSELVILFIVSHELGHHLAGHLSEGQSDWEFESRRTPCTLVDQGREVVADGHAAYFAARAISGPYRTTMIEWFDLRPMPKEEQSRALLAALVLTVSAYFIESSRQNGRPFDPLAVRSYCHPPAYVRVMAQMSHLEEAVARFLPEVADWFTPNTYFLMMRRVFGELSNYWKEEIEFSGSKEGRAYIDELLAQRDAYRRG